MLDTLEKHMEVFEPIAKSAGFDTRLAKLPKLYFQDVATQGAFMCWIQAYSMGWRDAEKENFKNGK